MHRTFRLAELILFLSQPVTFLFLVIASPSPPILVLLLVPIAPAAILYVSVGGLLAALITSICVALHVTLDPDAYRRPVMLHKVWPSLLFYLIAGPLASCCYSKIGQLNSSCQ